jgi:hypothetical protein
MLFRERVHDKHRATSIVAKVGDFGKNITFSELVLSTGSYTNCVPTNVGVVG